MKKPNRLGFKQIAATDSDLYGLSQSGEVFVARFEICEQGKENVKWEKLAAPIYDNKTEEKT